MANRPNLTPTPPTSSGLAAELDCLRKRVAVLEVVLGRVSDDTCADVPELAASALGVPASTLEGRAGDAMQVRAEQVAEAERVAKILEQQ